MGIEFGGTMWAANWLASEGMLPRCAEQGITSVSARIATSVDVCPCSTPLVRFSRREIRAEFFHAALCSAFISPSCRVCVHLSASSVIHRIGYLCAQSSGWLVCWWRFETCRAVCLEFQGHKTALKPHCCCTVLRKRMWAGEWKKVLIRNMSFAIIL